MIWIIMQSSARRQLAGIRTLSPGRAWRVICFCSYLKPISHRETPPPSVSRTRAPSRVRATGTCSLLHITASQWEPWWPFSSRSLCSVWSVDLSVPLVHSWNNLEALLISRIEKFSWTYPSNQELNENLYHIAWNIPLLLILIDFQPQVIRKSKDLFHL